jgi:hypothetical protein
MIFQAAQPFVEPAESFVERLLDGLHRLSGMVGGIRDPFGGLLGDLDSRPSGRREARHRSSSQEPVSRSPDADDHAGDERRSLEIEQNRPTERDRRERVRRSLDEADDERDESGDERADREIPACSRACSGVVISNVNAASLRPFPAAAAASRRPPTGPRGRADVARRGAASRTTGHRPPSFPGRHRDVKLAAIMNTTVQLLAQHPRTSPSSPAR